MIKKIKILLILLAILIGIILLLFYYSRFSVIKYKIYSDAYGSIENKYLITSEEGLKEFYKYNYVNLKINKNWFKNHKVFVQIKIKDSGITDYIFKKVNINNKVSFYISNKSYENEMGIDAISGSYYFVAIIPNEKLENVDLSDWKKL